MSFSGEKGRLRAEFFELLDVVGSVTVAARQLGVSRNTAFGWARAAGVKSVRQSAPAKAEFLALRAQGVSQGRAADRVGVNVRSARDWERGIRRSRGSRFYPDGRRVDYVSGETTMESMSSPPAKLLVLEKRLHPRFLSLEERERIADLTREGRSLRSIGRELGRPASTVKRELDRNTLDEHTYQPHAAHRLSASRRPRPKPAKLARPGPLQDYVADRLREQWSPEQISNMLPKMFPSDEGMRVSVETIYQAIYVQARGGLKREIVQALRTGRARRKPHRSVEHRTSRFADPMVMISDRPPEIEDRAIPGHWEGDLIIGAAKQSAIVTLVERSTRYVMLGHLPGGHAANEVRDVLVDLVATMPEHLRGSLTWDQGCEMAGHKEFRIATGVPVYFCDPASPWQRGSNENTNGLLRQYFPKGTDLSAYGPLDLEHVAQKLNGRPRKTLDWETPAERLHRLVLTD